MNSPDRTTATGRSRSSAFVHKVRQRLSSIPDRIDALEEIDDEARALDGFSIARIYTTFQLKRSEYFPVDLDDEAFDMLVDLFLYEWLNRRVGAQQAGGIRVSDADELPAGTETLVKTGLATATSDRNPDAPATIINLSRTGRARLNLYFDYMASYITAI